MTCDGCAMRKCGERQYGVGCDWKVDVERIVDILWEYDIEIVKEAVDRLEDRNGI